MWSGMRSESLGQPGAQAEPLAFPAKVLLAVVEEVADAMKKMMTPVEGETNGIAFSVAINPAAFPT